MNKFLLGLVMIGLLVSFQHVHAAVYVPPPPKGIAITLDTIMIIVNDIVTRLIEIAGVVVVGALVWGGLMWATAGSNEDRVTKAKAVITGALWGALVIFGVFVIISTIRGLVTGRFFTG